MATPSNSPQPLARFPAEIRAAFERFTARANAADLQIVVDAALHDFMPKRGAEAGGTIVLRDEQRLMEDLGFDSLAVAETVFFFEDLFKVSIQTSEIMELGTVGQLRAFVARKLAAKTAAP